MHLSSQCTHTYVYYWNTQCQSVCVYVCVHTRNYMHACMRAYVCVCMRVCMHACMHACVRVCVCVQPWNDSKDILIWEGKQKFTETTTFEQVLKTHKDFQGIYRLNDCNLHSHLWLEHVFHLIDHWLTYSPVMDKITQSPVMVFMTKHGTSSACQ